MASTRTNKWALRLTVVVAAAAAAFSLKMLTHPVQTLAGDIPVTSVTVGAVLAEGQNRMREVIPPDHLYHKAWLMIFENFYNKDFNNQDWNRWRDRYEGKLTNDDDAHKAIETMVDSLGDPYTRFLSKDSFDDEKDQIQAHLFGVGMQLGMNKEKAVVVIAPIQDTPAYRAGVHPGDEITEVDGKPIKGQSLDQVVKQIRGPEGSKVQITLSRNGERKVAEMTRAEVPIKAIADCETLPGDIGYIRLDSFISHKANDEMRDALKKVATDKGLILDLRNNPGGLLANAIDIASMFIDHGVVVSTVDADGYKQQNGTNGHVINTMPMVVLINQNSASASEILSGALHDHKRATLVGQKSFGKGLVQSINRLDDGSGINVTIAKYLTPNDTDINKQGIKPDVNVELTEDDLKNGKGPWWFDPNYTNFKRSPNDGKDVQLNRAEEVLKAQLANINTVATSSKH